MPARALAGRRAVLGAIASACAPWPFASDAARPAPAKGDVKTRMHRIGVICDGDDSIQFFWDQLRDLGYEEHRNLEILFKHVDASGNRAGIAASLATANVEVIVACSNPEAAAAMRATARTPIVLLYGAVPVETGLIASLARPGGNVTGSAAISTDLAAKSVDVLKSAVPTLRRVAAIVNPDDRAGVILNAASERAARALGMTLTTWPVADGAGLEKAFAALARDRPDGLLVNLSVVVPHLARIIDFAAREKLPAMYPVAPGVVQGGLLSYSPRWLPQSKRNAEIVDRILHGAQPRDIPVEQPVDYVLGVNLRTARAMGLTIPPPLLLRATLVIE